MNKNSLPKEPILISIAFVLALLLRLLYLNALPLSDPEAVWALQAFGIARGSGIHIGPQPLYTLVTGVLFYLFGDSNFIARLLPALAGSLLVLSPVLFRHRIGSGTAVWLAFALALDPGLVALSRQAGSSIPAIAFTVLAMGFFLRDRPIPAGICTGLALLGGPSFWLGGVALGVTWFIFRQWVRPKPVQGEGNLNPGFNRGKFLLALTVTLLVTGTLFFRVPAGISAFGSSLVEAIRGWENGGGVSPGFLLVGIGAYSLMAVPLATWSAIRAWMEKDSIDQALTLWLVLSLGLTLANPARQMSDAGWILVPLWALAARGLSRLPKVLGENRLPVHLFTLVAMVILFFSWLNFIGFLQAWQNNSGDQQIRGMALTGALVLLALTTILVAWGWSSAIAGMGITRAVLLMLLIYLVSGTISAAGWRSPDTADLWQTYPQPQAQKFLLETVGDISLWNTRNREAIEMSVVGIPSTSLRWTLRNMPNIRFGEALQPGSQPPLVLTSESQQPELAAAYRGQAFVWDMSPDWPRMSIFEQLYWIAYHTGPVQKQMTILWARTDLFLDRGISGTTSTVPSP